jgi:hypothetical protein
MAESQQVRFGDQIDGELVGRVMVEIPQEMIDAFDVVLAPVITIDLDDKNTPRVTGWQLVPRTSIDIRPRDPNPPHKHIGEGPKT